MQLPPSANQSNYAIDIHPKHSQESPDRDGREEDRMHGAVLQIASAIPPVNRAGERAPVPLVRRRNTLSAPSPIAEYSKPEQTASKPYPSRDLQDPGHGYQFLVSCHISHRRSLLSYTTGLLAFNP